MTESREPPLSRLQDLIRTRQAALGERGRPLSLREVARRSGDAFTPELLSAIMRGDHRGGLRDTTALGLAKALQVPVAEIYEAASVQMPEGRWVLPPRFDRLNATQRDLVESVAAALLEAYDKGRRDRT